MCSSHLSLALLTSSPQPQRCAQHFHLCVANRTRCRCVTSELCWSPALLMAGRAPLRAQRRLPPNGTYCWLRGRDSVFRSCRRCFSLRMEWTAFRKSFLLSGELHVGRGENVGKIWEGGVDERTVGLRSFILPAAQLEGSLWSSLRFRSRVNNLTQGRPLGV